MQKLRCPRLAPPGGLCAMDYLYSLDDTIVSIRLGSRLMLGLGPLFAALKLT